MSTAADYSSWETYLQWAIDERSPGAWPLGSEVIDPTPTGIWIELGEGYE